MGSLKYCYQFRRCRPCREPTAVTLPLSLSERIYAQAREPLHAFYLDLILVNFYEEFLVSFSVHSIRIILF